MDPDVLEKEVLQRIVPTPEQIGSIRERAGRLKGIVEAYVAEHGIDAEARYAGSFSKNTFLSDPDLDLFLMFPQDVSPEDMRRIGLQAGEDILHGTRMFSDHPYTRGRFEGLDVDLVPCYRLDSTEHLKSAVDRTPFHTAFIKSRLTDEGCDQVRLLKKFMKGIGTYGAEQDSRGFSGYLCELLVVRFGTFRGVLEAAAGWRKGTSIEVAGRGQRMLSPLVVYDPVDSRRNVASAVHVDTLCTFRIAAAEYLREPRMEFFLPNPVRPLDAEGLRDAVSSHGSRLVSAVFERPSAIEDNLQSQLWKTQYALSRKLGTCGFGVLRAVHGMDDASMTVVFELEGDSLPKACVHQGPPVWVDSEGFLSKWRSNPLGEPFVEDGHWTVIAERRYTTAASVIEAEAGIAGIGRDLDVAGMRVLDHDGTLDGVDPVLLTELLEPMFPWERPARRRPKGYLIRAESTGSGPVG